MRNSTCEEKVYLRRYRKHRCLAGRIYEQLGDIPEDRESFIQGAEGGLEANFQRNMDYVIAEGEKLI